MLFSSSPAWTNGVATPTYLTIYAEALDLVYGGEGGKVRIVGCLFQKSRAAEVEFWRLDRVPARGSCEFSPDLRRFWPDVLCSLNHYMLVRRIYE